MAETCRLCGKSEILAINIFGNEALKHHFGLKIRVGLDIQIFPDDPLPKYACVCCLGKLDEFWTFLHHCRKVQTNLRRLLPERVSIQFHDINRDEHQKSKTSTEECSPHIEVLETLGDSTGNDVNDSGYMNPISNSKVEVDKVNVDANSNENSNHSFHSSNELCGNECEPFENDPYFIERDLLVTTEDDTSLAAGQLDSYCQGREENMVFNATGFTSQSAPEYNPVTVETESEVQANLASKKTDLINTVHGRSETTLSAKNNIPNFQSISDRPQDPLLMEELTLELPNTVLSTTSFLTVAEEGPEDKTSNDTFSVNNDLNQNRLQAPNMIAQSSHCLTTVNNGCHSNQMTNTCGFLDNNSQPSSLMEEQPSKNRNHRTDGTQVISTVGVNIVSMNEKEVGCDLVFNTLRHPSLKGEVACKTTRPVMDTCSQNISVHGVNDEVPQGDGGDFSQHSLIITDLPLNHPNHVGRGMTNVSSGIEASSDDTPRYLLEKVCNTIPQVTGKLSRNTEFVLNGLSINGDCQPLRVMHSDADIADKSDQNMETSGRVSDLIGAFPVTIENEVHQTQQLNTVCCSDSNTNHESKDHSLVVNSGNSAICVHGIDATVCIYTKCCLSHPFDKYLDNAGSRFRCLLCKYLTRDKYKIRAHVCAHVPMKLFECSICHKKFRLFQKLSLHIITHSRKVDRSGEYSCENCSQTFETDADLQYHEIKMCETGSVSCPECGFLFSSLEKHKFRCSGKNGFVCNICDKSYMVKNNLIQHLRTHEQGEYASDKCEKMSPASQTLYIPQKSKGKSPRFKCTYCPSSFYFKSHFVSHLVTHTGTRNNGDGLPLEVIHSDADIAVISDQNMEACGKVIDLKDSVAVTSEKVVHESLQINTASCSDSNTSRENKDDSMIVNSEISATCVHGIDANMCINVQCCITHAFDKNWKKLGSCFRCLLCEYVTDAVLKIRNHVSAHVSLIFFECSTCYKTFHSYNSLTAHMKLHSRKPEGSSTEACVVYTCENCSKTFNSKGALRSHELRTCMIGSSLVQNVVYAFHH